MPTQDDVRQIALSLPGVEEAENYFSFSVVDGAKRRGIVWVWLERVDPKKGRVPNPRFMAARVRNVGQRDMMIAAEPDKFFTEPHYNGYPAVLVRLDAVTMEDLEILVTEAWRCLAPRELRELVLE